MNGQLLEQFHLPVAQLLFRIERILKMKIRGYDIPGSAGTTGADISTPQSLMEMMGYKAPDLPTLFGQYFEDVDPRWTEMFAPQFKATQTALGELPGLRGGMLGQLRGGLQQRGVAAGRELQARRAGAGFAGSGAIERLGRTTRRGLGEEYGRGMWGIGQDIARKKAGLLGGLRGRIGSFLEMLMAADVSPATGDSDVGAGDVGAGGWPLQEGYLEERAVKTKEKLAKLTFEKWLEQNEFINMDEFEGMEESDQAALESDYNEYLNGG